MPEPEFAQRPLAAVLEAIADRTPAPGGGSSSAWAGAMAAALVEMAARFAPERGRAGEIEVRAAALRAALLELAERELHSYAPVLEALRLPREHPERAQRARAARWAAAEAPLQIAGACAELAELGAEIAGRGSSHLVGDALAGVELAAAACRAAGRLAELNLHDAPADAPGRVAAAQLRARAGAAAPG